MKKFTMLLVALSVGMFSFVGCGDTKTKSKEEKKTTTTTETKEKKTDNTTPAADPGK